MKVKVFNIRLEKEFQEQDEQTLNAFLAQVIMKKSSTSLVQTDPPFWSVIIHYLEPNGEIPENQSVPRPKVKILEEDLSTKERELVGFIKKWRSDKSSLEGIPPYMILSNQAIYSLVKSRPESLAEMEHVHGFGERKVEVYGDDLLSILNTV